MKNLLILFLMIAFGFAAHAQLDAIKTAKVAESSDSFQLNKMEVNFSNFTELELFKKKITNGKSGLEGLQINRDFIFIYSIAESSKLKGEDISIGGMKVEITDQPNKTTLIKEIIASMDGLIEIAALGN